jgi:hypothetical protein
MPVYDERNILHISPPQRLSVQKLISEYGAGADLPSLKERLPKGCPRLENLSIHERCGAHFPLLHANF